LIRNGPEDDALQRGGVAAVAAPNPVASTVRSGGNADKRQRRVTREVLGCLTTIGMHRWAVERRGGVRWRPTPFKKEGFGLAVPREGNGGGGTQAAVGAQSSRRPQLDSGGYERRDVRAVRHGGMGEREN
jgi:hypothetical protein